MATTTDARMTPGLEETPAAAVARLRTTFDTGRTRDIAWRLHQLAGIERLITQEERAIAAAVAADLGRPAFSAWMSEVTPTRIEVRHARKNLKHWMRPDRARIPLTMLPGKASTVFDPLGVVGIIGPWNYPFYLSLGPMIGAFAAGNVVIVKPSEHAPACAATLAELLPRYVDRDGVAVVQGDASATQDVIAQGLDHVFFTGGPEIGKAIMAAAAPHLTPVTLELGGKCPAIVTADADLEVTARRLVMTKLMNSGQTCVAPDYVLVERSVQARLIELLSDAVRAQSADDPHPGLPIVNERQHARLSALLERTSGEVRRPLAGDPRPGTLAPTLVIDPARDDAVMEDEIFGPILPVVGVTSLEDAFAYVNAGPKPLAAYIFTTVKEKLEAMVRSVSAGAIVQNQVAMHVTIPQLPFGGVGRSGMGSYHGRWGFETFSHRKSVVAKPAKPDPKLMYPPYGERAQRIMRRVMGGS